MLKLTVYGLEELESRELEELLWLEDGVNDIKTQLSEDRVRPGVIYASATYVDYIIDFIVKPLAGVVVREVYVATKQRLGNRITDWKNERNREAGRERIRFSLSDQEEFMVYVDERPENRTADRS